MTLKKYIQRLADKLDPMKQFNRRKAAENIRKARPNQPIAMPLVAPGTRMIAVQYRRYGIAYWLGYRKHGLKNDQGQLLPLVSKSEP